MRILLVNHFPLSGSGSGVYTMTIAKFLKKRGHEVRIILPEVTTLYEQLKEIKIHPVYFKKEEIIAGQLPFNFPCFTTHPNSNNNFLELSEGELNLYIQAFDSVIREEVEEFKPDIIHSQHVWILSALASKHSIPLIVTVHGTDLIGYQNPNSTRFFPYVDSVIDQASKLITISRNNYELLSQLFPNVKQKCVLIPNGYDTTTFFLSTEQKKNILSNYGITQEYEKIILFVGKLTYIKGVDLLLNSMVSFKDGNVLTVIAGDGEEKETLLKQKEFLGLSNVVFIGNVTQKELQKLYTIADVSVVPSRKEAFGFVAVESLACGTPVIGTDQGELPNFINEKTGILIATDKEQELTCALKSIIEEKISYQKEEIAQFAQKNYSLEYRIDQLIQLYEQVIKEHS